MSAAPFSDALRAAVKADGRTSYAIAQSAGVRIQVLTRWLSGERDLRLASADKLAAAVSVSCTRCPPVAAEDEVVTSPGPGSNSPQPVAAPKKPAAPHAAGKSKPGNPGREKKPAR